MESLTKSNEPLFSSESQERLVALLQKAFDVVPFAPDDACEDMFVQLARFCESALEKRNLRKEAKFSQLDIEL
jgi:predicted Zn-dependent protease with MMP-like domain